MLKWCCDVVLTLEWRHYNVASLFSNKGLNVINREKKALYWVANILQGESAPHALH